jgi:hypothetical protein
MEVDLTEKGQNLLLLSTLDELHNGPIDCGRFGLETADPLRFKEQFIVNSEFGAHTISCMELYTACAVESIPWQFESG